MATSVYSNLPSSKSIRLIQLQPGKDETPISCSLLVFCTYEMAPEYHALSYCWGDPQDRTKITCNGEALEITKSLDAALRRHRRNESTIPLWADALIL
jgi:hypothetical protein